MELHEPDEIYRYFGDTAHRYGQGRLDLESALDRGEIVVEGDRELLRLLKTESDGFSRNYLDLLRREGRQDLLPS